jgi:hypothetical protein
MHNTTAATGFHLQTSILLPCDVNTYAELNTKAQNFVEIDLALKTPTSQILIPQIFPAHPKPGSHYHHPSLILALKKTRHTLANAVSKAIQFTFCRRFYRVTNSSVMN